MMACSEIHASHVAWETPTHVLSWLEIDVHLATNLHLVPLYGPFAEGERDEVEQRLFNAVRSMARATEMLADHYRMLTGREVPLP